MKKILLFPVNIFRALNFKKIFVIFFIFIFSAILIFSLWWSLFFFPNDYKLTEKEALIPPENKPFEKKSADLIYDLKKASFKGDFSSSRIKAIVDSMKSKGFLIKKEGFIEGRGSEVLFRAGTGHIGLWVDERSSILLPEGSSISYDISLSGSDSIDLSFLCAEDSVLNIRVLHKGKDIFKQSVDIPAYIQEYTHKDVKMKYNNRGYPYSKADNGWLGKKFKIDTAPGIASLELSVPKESSPIFIGNPALYRTAEPDLKKYNVIYLLFDGIPLKYLSPYNKDSKLTPYMAERAEKDYIVFNNMIAPGDKTRISLSGLFTSMVSSKTRHGINRNLIPKEERELFYRYVREGKFASLPDVFRKNGYESVQFGDSGFTIGLLGSGVDYGFQRSYEFSYNPYDTFGFSRHLFSFFRENKNRNFFAYVHYNTPRRPFYAPLSYYIKGFFQSPSEGRWRPDFLGPISYSGDVFENVYKALETNNLLENSIVVIVSDHGSGFDFSKFDGGFQYNDYIKQIFMIYLPESLREELKAPIGTRDTYAAAMNISPTLTELSGIGSVKQFHGKSLIPVLKDEYKEDMWDDLIWCMGRKAFSLITPDLMKYIVTSPDSRKFIKWEHGFFGNQCELKYEALYDIGADPLENNNLVNTDRAGLARMRNLFFESDIHHPEKTILTFFPGDDKKKNVVVKISTPTPLLRAEIYDVDLNSTRQFDVVSSGHGKKFEFSVEEPVYFVFEQENDRAPLSVEIFSDGKRLSPDSIYATDLNINLFQNPLIFNTREEFRVAGGIRLPLQEGWTGDGSDLSVKVTRIDLHRWIDLSHAESKGLSASMKETLRSWGYIQ